MKGMFVKKLYCLLLGILLALGVLPPLALGEPAKTVAYQIEKRTIEGANGVSIVYPVLTGGVDEISASVSAAIYSEAHIDECLSAAADSRSVLTFSYGYVMDYRRYSEPLAPYLSLLITETKTQDGAIIRQQKYPMTFDLATGDRISFDQLFTDPLAARAWIQAEIENTVANEIAPCISRGSLLPIPFERYYISGEGDILLFYDRDQLEFVSGNAGTVSFLYDELWPFLDQRADGAPMSLVLGSPIISSFATRYVEDYDLMDKLSEATWNLTLYGMTSAVFLSTPLEQAIQDCHGLISEGAYAGSSTYLCTEDAQMRGTYLITDERRQVVTGIYSTRINDAGFITGQTPRAHWLAEMGEPQKSISLDAKTAKKYLTTPGIADVYDRIYDPANLLTDSENPAQYGLSDRLQYILFSNEDGILQGILFRFTPLDTVGQEENLPF